MTLPGEHPLRTATRLLIGPIERARVSNGRIEGLLRGYDEQDVFDFWQYNKVVNLATSRAAELLPRRTNWIAAELAHRQVSRQRGLVQELAAQKVVRVIQREGLEAVVIKGPSMARMLYGATDLRDPSSDIDVLVHPRSLEASARILERHGWHKQPEPIVTKGRLPDLHYGFWGRGETPNVELHWRVQWYDYSTHTANVLSRRTYDSGLPVPSAEDTLGILLLAYARDGFHRLRLAADIAAWWDRFGPEHGDHALSEFRSSGLSRPLLLAVSAVEAVFQTPLQAERTDSTVRTRLASAVACRDERVSNAKLVSQVALVDAIAAPNRRHLRHLRVSLLSHADAIAERHPRAPKNRVALQLLRLIRGLRTTAHMVQLAVTLGNAETVGAARGPDDVG